MFLSLDSKMVAIIGVILVLLLSLLFNGLKFQKSSKYLYRSSVEQIVYGAMLTTMAVIVKFTFQVMPIPDMFKRFELFVIFIILAGILLGPLYGGLVGFVTDLIYMFIFPGTFGLFTLSHIAVGFIPGLLVIILKYNFKAEIFTVTLSVLAYFTINTIALNQYGYIPANLYTVSFRLARTLLVLPVQLYVIHLLTFDRRFSIFNIYKDFYDRQNIDY